MRRRILWIAGITVPLLVLAWMGAVAGQGSPQDTPISRDEAIQKALPYNEFRSQAGSRRPSVGGPAPWESDVRTVWVVTFFGPAEVPHGPPGLNGVGFSSQFDNMTIILDATTGDTLAGKAYADRRAIPWVK